MNDTNITLTGWVGSDVTLRDVAGGHRVANFRVACTTRRLRDGEWTNVNTTWYQVKAWRRLADNLARSVHRGDPVVVQGRLEAEMWTKDDGTIGTQLVVTATSVGHDLSLGTAVFSRPAPVEQPATEAPSGEQTAPHPQPETPDPWAAPLSRPAPSFATDAPTPEGGPRVDAA